MGHHFTHECMQNLIDFVLGQAAISKQLQQGVPFAAGTRGLGQPRTPEGATQISPPARTSRPFLALSEGIIRTHGTFKAPCWTSRTRALPHFLLAACESSIALGTLSTPLPSSHPPRVSQTPTAQLKASGCGLCSHWWRSPPLPPRPTKASRRSAI